MDQYAWSACQSLLCFEEVNPHLVFLKSHDIIISLWQNYIYLDYCCRSNLIFFFWGCVWIFCCCCWWWWCREIMHAMWRPVRYKYVYVFTCLYVWSITIPHCLAMYWAFGDVLLKRNNAFAVLPSSNVRSAAIVMMIIHQVLRSSPSSDLRLLSSSLLTPFCVAS